jgi:hypothetical protein
MNFRAMVCGALVLTGTAFGQSDYELHARRMPGWDPRSREGRCTVHVWVDNRAEVRMRGDSIFVRTLEGSRARDEGSECSQPMPFSSVRDFQVRQIAGRNRVAVAEQPDRRNNFTATIVIEDPQGGGGSYAFEASWRGGDEDMGRGAPPPPAAFFDDVRACQDTVRQRFLSQNGRGSYVDFDRFADRRDGGNAGNGAGWGRGRAGVETIAGRGTARNRNESRDIEYSCTVDTVRGQVTSGDYRFVRADGRLH